jgi:hypothetical protein
MTKIERAARRAWLDGLKQGDKVTVVHGPYEDRVVVQIGMRLDHAICTSRDWHHPQTGRGLNPKQYGKSMIVPVTEMDMVREKVNHIRAKLSRAEWGRTWTDEQIMKVAEILGL